MSRDNDVFQILVTKGNKAVLGANSKIEDLTDGQIGVFNSNTNMSIDGTTTGVKEFYIAVGVAGADGTLQSVNQSANHTIQLKGLNAYTFRPHTAGRPQIVEVKDFIGKCDTDYALKIQFSNSRITRTQGTAVQYSHVYNVRTGCCVDCADNCNSYDCNKIVQAFVEKINNDDKGLVIAEAWDATANDGAGAVVTDIDAFIATNATVNEDTDMANDVCLALRLTSKPLNSTLGMNGGINLGYYAQTETTMIVSLVAGFGCGGTITTVQDAAYEEGSGADVQMREYKAGGWNGRPGPYRTSAVTGLPNQGFLYFADASAKYDKVVLEYQDEHQGGWLDYKNELATEIVIPIADTITKTGLIAVLDRLATKVGLDALADDAALANANPAVVELTEDIDDVTKDGLA